MVRSVASKVLQMQARVLGRGTEGTTSSFAAQLPSAVVDDRQSGSCAPMGWPDNLFDREKDAGAEALIADLVDAAAARYCARTSAATSRRGWRAEGPEHQCREWRPRITGAALFSGAWPGPANRAGAQEVSTSEPPREQGERIAPDQDPIC